MSLQLLAGCARCSKVLCILLHVPNDTDAPPVASPLFLAAEAGRISYEGGLIGSD